MLQFLIREAGFIPQQRDILYKHVNRPQIFTDKQRSIREDPCESVA
jgi:2-iminoacetate synthase ThiH